MTSKDALEVFDVRLSILGGANMSGKTRDGSFAESVEGTLEIFVLALVEETECTTTTCGVIDNFGHDVLSFAKIEFVADTDFARWVYKHVPEVLLMVQFAKQKHFDASSCFFLTSIEAGGENPFVGEKKKDGGRRDEGSDPELFALEGGRT